VDRGSNENRGREQREGPQLEESPKIVLKVKHFCRSDKS
jgi:hypothetical protein